MPRILVEILGDADGFLRANRQSREAAKLLGVDLKKVGLDAKTSAQAQVNASIRKQVRLREEASAAHSLASTYKRGSLEQRTAAELATKADLRLARSIGLTARESARFGASASHAEREIGRASRGALAGTGVFRGLGRSIAFASGGFLAFASGGQLLRSSIDAATQEAATQRQLAAQFHASGQELKLYRGQIDATTTRLSVLSGFTKDDLTQSFTTAYRGSKNVAVSLKLDAIAADVARGRHIQLAQATLALTKAYGGQSTALRRLGILVPKHISGMQALNFVEARFAGQARAGTTFQQRFAAELHNTEVTIGTALLPTVTRLTTETTHWLAKSKNQARIQRDVAEGAKLTGEAITGLAAAFHVAKTAISPVVHLLGGAKNTAEVAGVALLVLKARSAAAALGLRAASTQALTLRTRLLSLRALGTIAITVAVAFEIAKGGQAFSKWLGGTGFGKAFGAGDTPTKDFLSQLQKAVAAGVDETQLKKLLGSGVLNKSERAAVNKAIKAMEAAFRTGLNTQDRQPGRSPGGPAAQPGKPGAEIHPRASLRYQLSLVNEQLAKAEQTTSKTDDRAVLERKAALLRQLIAKTTDLKARTKLYQQLGSADKQIQAIDKAQTAQEKTVEAKRRTAREQRERFQLGLFAGPLAKAGRTLTTKDDRAVLERKAAFVRELLGRTKDLKERTWLNQQLASVQKQLAGLDKKQLEAEKKAREKRVKAFQVAVDTARSAIGALFAGPVLQPTAEQQKSLLGVPGPTAANLTKDLQAQVAQARRFDRDLGKLKRQGASPELLKELRAQGTAALPQIEALTGAKSKDRKDYFAEFRQREKLAHREARMAIHAVHVQIRAQHVSVAGAHRSTTHSDKSGAAGSDQHLHVHLDGKQIAHTVTKHQTRAQKNRASQSRGRQPGR